MAVHQHRALRQAIFFMHHWSCHALARFGQLYHHVTVDIMCLCLASVRPQLQLGYDGISTNM
jgi:hypothetical protein